MGFYYLTKERHPQLKKTMHRYCPANTCTKTHIKTRYSMQSGNATLHCNSGNEKHEHGAIKKHTSVSPLFLSSVIKYHATVIQSLYRSWRNNTGQHHYTQLLKRTKYISTHSIARQGLTIWFHLIENRNTVEKTQNKVKTITYQSSQNEQN